METKNFTSLIEKSKNILVIVPPNPTDDIISSAFAMSRFLEKRQKQATLVLGDEKPHRLSFLKTPNKVMSSLAGLRDFVLIFKTEHNKIMNIESQQKEGEFIVHITPEKGSIDPRDFSFVPADFKHDLLIIIGAPGLDSLGQLYQSNTDLFFEVPKINIDNKNENESYGQVNIVDLAASSISEICANLFLGLDEKYFDQEIAQALLTGIIAETQSFQKPTTTPRAMIVAAKLMKHRADQSIVIQHLFKTKSFSFLKLWGRVMARLNWDEDKKLAWSIISTEDLIKSRANEKDIPFVLEEIQRNFMAGHVFAILYPESPKTSLIQMHVSTEKKRKALSQLYEIPDNAKTLKMRVEGKDILETEKDLLEKVAKME